MREVRPILLSLLALAVSAGCDDPAAGLPASPLVGGSAAPVSTAPTSPSARAAAPAISSATGSEGESTLAAPSPSVAAQRAPATPEGALPALSAAPLAPRATGGRTSGPHTGILKGAEADGIIPKGAKPRVTLLEPGAAPRTPTRYALTTSASTGIEMGLSMTIEVAQGGRTAPPQRVPRIATLLDLVTAGAPRDGALGIDATIKKVSIAEDTGIPQQIAEKLAPHLKGIEGLALHYDVTPEGRIANAGAKLPPGKESGALDGTLTQMTQSLESMIAPFPTEEIGIGARWEVVSRFDSSGTELVQWSTFQLRERDDKGVKLDLEVVQAAAKPEVTPPNLPAGVTAKLVEFNSTGKGQSTIDFSFPAPRLATMRVQSNMALAIDQNGVAGASTSMKSTMVVDMKRANGAKATSAGKAPAAPATPQAGLP